MPLIPSPSPWRDRLALALCLGVTIVMLAMILVPGYASFIKFWPYNLELTLRNYEFHRFAGGGWESYINSLKLSLLTATVGSTMVFGGAYLSEKSRAPVALRNLYQMLAMFPLAVPGLVLGLSYVFFLNDPDNPLEMLYGTLAVLVISTIVHFYTVSHLTAVTALRQLDNEFELVSDCLKVSRLRTFVMVTLPLCLHAVLDIWIYLFLSAMTTVSAAVFLYSHKNIVASITVINMDDAGEYCSIRHGDGDRRHLHRRALHPSPGDAQPRSARAGLESTVAGPPGSSTERAIENANNTNTAPRIVVVGAGLWVRAARRT